MVLFGRNKEKIEDRRLLASMDAMDGGKGHQVENGKFFFLLQPARAHKNHSTLNSPKVI